jgi:hypothetical protein
MLCAVLQESVFNSDHLDAWLRAVVQVCKLYGHHNLVARIEVATRSGAAGWTGGGALGASALTFAT